MWCAHGSSSDPQPNVNLTFTEPVYLLYYVVRGDSNDNTHVTNFSLKYENSSGGSVAYMNVNGDSVRHFITYGPYNYVSSIVF